MDVNGDLILYTVTELASVEIYTIDETLVERTYLEEVDNSNNNIEHVTFYTDTFIYTLDNDTSSNWLCE